MYNRISYRTRIIQGKESVGNIPSVDSRDSEFEPRVALVRRLLEIFESINSGVPRRY